MSLDGPIERKSSHRLAFDHYLRTGQRLTTAQWCERSERKFNPYHDEIGRFTSAPGATVSWGASQPPQATRLRKHRDRFGVRRPPAVQDKLPASTSPKVPQSATTRPRLLDGLQTERVSNAAIPGDHAYSYFDLLKRQIDLDAFRATVLSDPDGKITADLDEVQRRYDADRRILDYRARIADQQALEIGRAGMVPVDVLAGGLKIAQGEGELRDYFSVGSVVPVTAVLRYVRGVPQIAGSRSMVTSIIRDLKLTGFDRHHNWAKAAMDGAGLRLPPDMIPMTVLIRPDHMSTGSWGSSFSAIRYRAHQSKLLEQGKLSEAAIMDVKNIDDVTGGAYSHANEETLRFVREIEKKLGR